MLKDVMEEPLRNRNQSINHIYDTVANNVIDKGCGNHRIIAWIFKKIIRNKHEKVQDLVDAGVQSLHDVHGYADAFNTALIELLKEVEKSIRTSTGTNAETPLILSPEQERILTGLIRNLFDVLKKSECTTIPELRKLNKGERTNRNVMDVLNEYLKKHLHLNVEEHVANEVIQNATLILARSLNRLAQADKLQELTHNLIKNLNDVYKPIEGDDQERQQREVRERQQRKTQVQTLTTNILRKSISKAVNERLNPKVQQIQVNEAIEKLSQKSTAWIDATERQLQALGRYDLGTPEARTCIQTLYNDATSFHREQELELTDIRNKEWGERNKNQVLKRYQNLAQASASLTKMIQKLESNAYLCEKKPLIAPAFKAIVDRLKSKRSNTSIKTELRELSQHLPRNIYTPLENHYTAYRNAKINRAAFKIEIEWLNTLPEKIEEIIRTKPIGQWQKSKLVSKLNQEINTHVTEERQRAALLDALKLIVRTPTGDTEEAAKSAFMNLTETALKRATEALKAQSESIGKHRQDIQKVITDTHLLELNYVQLLHTESESEMQHAVSRVKEYRKSLQEHGTPVPFANIAPIDPNTLKKTAKSVVYNVVKGYTDELLLFISRKGIPHALLNHMVLIPYNKYEERRRRHPELRAQRSAAPVE